jgi:hypothetical protein
VEHVVGQPARWSFFKRLKVVYLPPLALAWLLEKWDVHRDVIIVSRGWVDAILTVVIAYIVWYVAVAFTLQLDRAWKVSERVEALSDYELDTALRRLEAEKKRRSEGGSGQMGLFS